MPTSIHIDSTHVAKFGNGSKIIVGLHGWAGAYTDLNVFGEWLDPQEYTLYAIEMPGRGLSKSIDENHRVEDLVRFLEITIEQLKIERFSLITDFGFSQVSIKYAHYYPEKINGILFIYMPLIVPSLIKLHHLLYAYPFLGLYAKTRKLDWTINKIRNSDKIMHKVFLRNSRPEAIELELKDIENKRRADLNAIFKSGWNMLNSNVLEEWANLQCKIEVVLAEKDEIFSTKKGIPYLTINPQANITVVKDHNHNWDNEFIEVMREKLLNII